MANVSQAEIADLKEKAVANAEFFYHYKLVARSIGRDEETLLRWRKDDPTFEDRLQVARAIFIKKQMGRAKPDFLLERLEREVFGPKLEISGGLNPLLLIIQKYGGSEGVDDIPRVEEITSRSLKDPA